MTVVKHITYYMPNEIKISKVYVSLLVALFRMPNVNFKFSNGLPKVPQTACCDVTFLLCLFHEHTQRGSPSCHKYTY